MISRPRSVPSLALALAVALGACVTDDVDDLGVLEPDGKADTALPRQVTVELEPGEIKRFRITTAAFVARLAQAHEVPAQLSAKHFELDRASEVSPTPSLEVIADGTVRTWTLRVHNRGEATLTATVVIDVPRRPVELGIVSDIDKTVLPPETASGLPPPYPGIALMLRTLELRDGGAAGDLHYVTARTPDAVAGIPAWMELHQVPAGPIETGISGVPWIAQPEKVADIARILDARPGQAFVLFGDTSHRDPEAYAEIRARYPDRIAAIFIHKVNATVSAQRVSGMHLVTNYAEAAAIALGRGLLDEVEARAIMQAARDQGLALTDDELEALLSGGI